MFSRKASRPCRGVGGWRWAPVLAEVCRRDARRLHLVGQHLQLQKQMLMKGTTWAANGLSLLHEAWVRHSAGDQAGTAGAGVGQSRGLRGTSCSRCSVRPLARGRPRRRC